MIGPRNEGRGPVLAAHRKVSNRNVPANTGTPRAARAKPFKWDAQGDSMDT